MCVMQAMQQVLVAVQTEYQAKQERQAGDAAERMANNDAKLAEQGAADSATLAARESQQNLWATRGMIGKQRTGIAAAGVEESGTAAAIVDETALFGGANQSAIAQNAYRAAWGFNAEALQHRNRGKLLKWEGHQKAKFTKLNGAMQSLSIWSNPMSSPQGGSPSPQNYGGNVSGYGASFRGSNNVFSPSYGGGNGYGGGL